MRTALKHRLARIETLASREDDGGFKVWLDGDDGEMIGPDGNAITVEEFERRYPDAIDIGGPLGGPSGLR